MVNLSPTEITHYHPLTQDSQEPGTVVDYTPDSLQGWSLDPGHKGHETMHLPGDLHGCCRHLQ